MMSDEELEQLREKTVLATSGPWRRVSNGVIKEDDYGGLDICTWPATRRSANSFQENMEFIAAANPQIVLAMIAEIRRLRRDKE